MEREARREPTTVPQTLPPGGLDVLELEMFVEVGVRGGWNQSPRFEQTSYERVLGFLMLESEKVLSSRIVPSRNR